MNNNDGKKVGMKSLLEEREREREMIEDEMISKS